MTRPIGAADAGTTPRRRGPDAVDIDLGTTGRTVAADGETPDDGTNPAGSGGPRRTVVPPGEVGQASVETVAIAPLVAIALLVVTVALRAHDAQESAGMAAHAAGIALMQGRDPSAAAKAAVPDVPADRLRVRVRGDRVSVRVRASGPRALVARFDATQTVHARPEGSR
ncbi:MAG: hypothetical protein M0P31_02755 [Solirubrobacteraceae bacterium]|nr:hypothetical protein [Solirubrobacteraceae bacterium]